MTAPQAPLRMPALPVAPLTAAGPTEHLALLAAVAIGLVVFLVVTVLAVPAQPSASSPSPSPTIDGPHLIAAHRLVTDTVPGGGQVVTQAFDSMRIVSSTGATSDFALKGVAVGTPAFDGVSRVVYWSRPSLASGSYRLVVWDATTGQERVVFTLSDEGISGDPLWSADGGSLIVNTRTADGERVRLNRVEVNTAAVTLLSETRTADALSPIYADDAIVVGLRGQTYVVLDARTGRKSSETPMRAPRATEFVASRSGIVLELVRAFEGESGPLRIWRVSDPGATVGTIDERGITTPLYWSATAEVVYVRGLTIYAFNPTTGGARVLAAFAPSTGALSLVGFTRGGDSLMVRIGDRFRALKMLAPSNPPFDLQLGPFEDFVLSPSAFEPIGVAP
jgi:hypothetical protein